MNRWKPLVLHEGEGNIRNVKWRGHLIAWANNMVSIFHLRYMNKTISMLHRFFNDNCQNIHLKNYAFVELGIKGIER